MIACYVFDAWKKNYVWQNVTFFIRDRCCHLLMRLHLMKPRWNWFIFDEWKNEWAANHVFAILIYLRKKKLRCRPKKLQKKNSSQSVFASSTNFCKLCLARKNLGEKIFECIFPIFLYLLSLLLFLCLPISLSLSFLFFLSHCLVLFSSINFYFFLIFFPRNNSFFLLLVSILLCQHHSSFLFPFHPLLSRFNFIS